MTTADLVKVAKDVFIRSVGTAFKGVVSTYLPFLEIPPINILTNQAIDFLVSKIADLLELGGFFLYTDYRVNEQGKVFVDASHLAINQPTEENKRIADEKFKLFAHLNSL